MRDVLVRSFYCYIDMSLTLINNDLWWMLNPCIDYRDVCLLMIN